MKSFDEIIEAIGIEPYYLDREYGQVIYCGDCRDILPKIPDKSIDLVLTDPPYFVPANAYVATRKAQYPRRLLGDASMLKRYYQDTVSELDSLVASTGTYYVFCDAQSYPIFYEVLYQVCSHVRLLVWDKVISYNGYTWRHQHELITWGEKHDTVRVPTGDGDVLRYRGVLQKDRQHPAEKPLELLRRLIAKHESTLILDPFMGSGTTLVAAQALGRKSIGIEIEEKYCKVAVDRLRQSVMGLDV